MRLSLLLRAAAFLFAVLILAVPSPVDSAAWPPLATGTAFGDAEEIDLLNDGSDCGNALPPVSGLSKFAIHRQDTGLGDAFAFDLAEPVFAGASYRHSFYAVADTLCACETGEVLIGLSNDPTDFGTLIYSGLPAADEWTYFESGIKAPVYANYLTVRVTADVMAWNHIDEFRLVLTDPTTSTGEAPALPTGPHVERWDGTDDTGQALPSGV